MRALILLFFPAIVFAVPQPVRDTAYDWRCVNPDGTATNHQRQDTAIYACQTRAEANPGQTYYIEGGRYRVSVDAPTDPVADLTYTSQPPSPYSVHPDAPAGSRIEVQYLRGQDIEVRPNGAVSCVGSQCEIAIRVNGGAWETWTW